LQDTKQNLASIEYSLNDDDIVYFLHIPKTAGTTLIAILDSYFDFDSIYPWRFWPKLLRKIPDFTKYKLVRGHFGYGLHRLLPKKPVYVTILRDPIERTISDYDHRVRDPDPLYKEKYSKNQSIAEFFSDKEKRKTFENMHTLHIGLDPDILLLTKSYGRKSIHRFRFREELPYWADDVSKKELLETAKQRLANFEFVGIAEKFEESLFLLYYTFGWRPISSTWRLNIAKKRPRSEELPSEAVAKIRECVQLDIELYNYAKQLFEQRYSRMVHDLKTKYYKDSYASLSPTEMMYKMLEKHYESRLDCTHYTLVTTLDYDFRPKLSGSGWYYREVLEETGETFRWTGPHTVSTIDFPLVKENDLVVKVSVMRAIAPDIMDSLKLKVNNHPIKLERSSYNHGRATFEGVIPKSALAGEKPFTRLVFEINRTINPHEINPTDPTNRFLGVAINRIKIVPKPS